MTRALSSKVSSSVSYMLVLSGSLMSLGSMSWVGVWGGLELSMVGCCGLFVGAGCPLEIKSTLKYFLMQAISSLFMVMGFLSRSGFLNEEISMPFLLISAFIKTGIFPFWFWVVGAMQGISWGGNWILSTVQKVIPLFVMAPFLKEMEIMSNFCGVMSVLIGGIEGVRQTSLRGIFGCSSVSNTGWLLLIVSSGEMSTYLTYSLIYSFMMLSLFWGYSKFDPFNFAFMQGSKSNQFLFWLNLISILSLAALPPFLGFIPKLVAMAGLSMKLGVFSCLLLGITIFSMWFYLGLLFSFFMCSLKTEYFIKKKVSFKNGILCIVFASIQLFGGGMFFIL